MRAFDNTTATAQGPLGGIQRPGGNINDAIAAATQRLGGPRAVRKPLPGRRPLPYQLAGGPNTQHPTNPGAGGQAGGAAGPPSIGKPQAPPPPQGGPWQQPGLPIGDPPMPTTGTPGTQWAEGTPDGQSMGLALEQMRASVANGQPPANGGPHQFPITQQPPTVQLPPELMSQDPSSAPPVMPPSDPQQPMEMPPVGAPPPQMPQAPPVVGGNFQGQHGGTQQLGQGRYGGAPPASVMARRQALDQRQRALWQGQIAATAGAPGGGK